MNEHDEQAPLPVVAPTAGSLDRIDPLEPTGLIRLAIESGKVDVIERLLVMRTQLKAEAAKEAFHRALSAFQADCPTIAKRKIVKDKYGKERYRYAPLEDILAEVGPLLQKHGFSHVEDAQVEPGWVVGLCTAHHAQGHSETSTFKVPIDPEAFMNEAQKYASALTFAKRYAFLARFGILTGDEDDDSQASGEPGKTASPASPKPVSTKVAGPSSQTAPLKDLTSLLNGFQERCKAQLVSKAQAEPKLAPYWQQYAADKGWILPTEGIEAIMGHGTQVFVLNRAKDIQGNSASVKDQFLAHENAVQLMAMSDQPTKPVQIMGRGDVSEHGCPNCHKHSVVMSHDYDGILLCQHCGWQWDIETGDYYEEHLWARAVCPIPPRGTSKKDYHIQTLGQIARTEPKRFYGLVMNNQEATGWVGRDGKQRDPSRADVEFAAACRAAALHMNKEPDVAS